jgi:hypothetical protein
VIEESEQFVDLYTFFWWAFAWIATVAIMPACWPTMALAYKIQNGPRPIAIDSDEYWTRSLLSGLFLGVLTAGFVFIDYVLSDWIDLPPGPIHLVVFMAYVPAASWLLFMTFAYTDYLDGLSVLMIYLCLLILVLFLVNAATGLWEFFLGLAKDWLKKPA